MVHELGAHTNYYIQGHLYNPAYHRGNTHVGNMPTKYIPEQDRKLIPDKDFFRRVSIIEPNGTSLQPYAYEEQTTDSAKKEWQDFLIDWTMRFIRDYHADGVYYDGFAIGSAYPSINYDSDRSTTGDWGRGSLRTVRTAKEEGRKINPDVVFGLEGCSDVYQQYGDWGLMSCQNAMEMFRYTFPDLIVIGGAANGDPKTALEQVYMNAYRMNDMLHLSDTKAYRAYDFLRPWAARVAKIRQTINPFLLRARFMDTVGVLHRDEGVDARLMVRNDDQNKGALVLLHNKTEAAERSVTVSTKGWGSVRAAWLVTHEGVTALAGTSKGERFTFPVPADKYSAVLLINCSEPLIDKREVPLGIAPGATVQGNVAVLNVNPEPVTVVLCVTGPKGFGGKPIRFTTEPGASRIAEVAHSAPANARVMQRVDLLLTASFEVVPSRVAPIHHPTSHTVHPTVDWLLPARVVGPLDARLARSGDCQVTLTIHNRSPLPISGKYELKMKSALTLSPARGLFSVHSGETTSIPAAVDLTSLQDFENVIAEVTAAGVTAEAYCCVGPYVMNADFELASFGLGRDLADGGFYDHYLRKANGNAKDLGPVPHIVWNGAYSGQGCLRIPQGSPAHIAWNAWLVPNKRYRISIAIKRTAAKGGGFQMSAAGDICQSPFLGATQQPKLNEWEVFFGEFTTGAEAPHWQTTFHSSADGDIFYDALRIEEGAPQAP